MSKLSICTISPGLSGGGTEDIAIKSTNFFFKKNSTKKTHYSDKHIEKIFADFKIY